MKKLLSSVSAVLGLFLSLSASAQLTPGITLERAPLGGIRPEALLTTVYNGIAGPYAAFAVGTGVLGFDNYTSIAPPPIFNLTTFQFVGGVTFTGAPAPIDRALRFDFFDADTNPLSSFSVALPSSGDFIWTINLNTPISVASTGFVQATTLGTSQGRWFLTTSPPTVGSNSFSVGGFPPTHNHAFAMVSIVPEPGSAALMLGFLSAGAGFLVRRRRK